MRLRLLSFAVLTFFTLAGCSEADLVRGSDERIQSAVAGSCDDSCGGQSPDGCWCDDLCETYGDCCDDYEPVCKAPPPPPSDSCEGTSGTFCDGQSPDGCWCNAHCVDFGDCCPDYEAVCVDDPPPPPPGDDPWSDLSDAALINALQQATSATHNGLSYTAARNYMYGITGSGIDVVNGQIECIYTGVTAAPDGTRTPGGLLNTEHSWPQSDGAGDFPRKGDIHHLFPSEMNSNSQRSNHDFGETSCSGSSCPWAQGGSERGTDSSGNTVFQVRLENRGDAARAHFYFSVRYGLGISGPEEQVLRAWDDQDPPSQRERDRNDAIEAVQGNRNPFVDYPQIADRISDF